MDAASGYDYCWSEIRESRAANPVDDEWLKTVERMVIMGFFVDGMSTEKPDSYPPCGGATSIRRANSEFGRLHECTMPDGARRICLGPYCSPEMSPADYDALFKQFHPPAKVCRGFIAQDVFDVAQREDAGDTRPLTARDASKVLSGKVAPQDRTVAGFQDRAGIYIGSSKHAFRVHVPYEFGAFTTRVISARKIWRSDVEKLRQQADLLDHQYCNDKMGGFFVYTFVEGPYLKEFGSKIPWETLSEYCYTHDEGLPTMRVSSERIRGLDGQSRVRARQQLVMVGSVRSRNRRQNRPQHAFATISSVIGNAPIQLKFEDRAFLPVTFTARDIQLPAVRNPIFIDPSGLLILARAMGPAGLPDDMTVYVFFDGEANLVSIQTEPLERMAGDYEQPYRVVARREGYDLATIDVAGDAGRTIRDLRIPLVRNALSIFKE